MVNWYPTNFVQNNANGMPLHPPMFQSNVAFKPKMLNPRDYGLSPGVNVYDVGRTGAAKNAKLRLWCQQRNQWIQVDGCLDSGCFTNCGSLQLHGQYCRVLKEVTGTVYMKMPNGQLEKGYMKRKKEKIMKQ